MGSTQKGSVKDRLRAWFLFVKYKKMKRKKELQIKKNKLDSIKHYNKFQVFYITAFGLFMGLFEPKSTKIEKKEVKVRINKINEEINVCRNQILTNKISLDIKERISLIENEIKEINQKKDINNMDLIGCKKNYDDLKKQILLKTEQKTNTTYNEAKESTVSNVSVSKAIDMALKKDKGIYIPIEEIKSITKKIKEYDTKLKNINIKLQLSNNLDEYYDYEYEIKQLKLRFLEITVDLDRLKEINDFGLLYGIVDIETIDSYNLRKKDNNLKKKIIECNLLLENIELKRKQILNNKRKTNIESNEKNRNSKEKKIEQKKKEIKEVDKKIDELLLANQMINHNIIQEQKMISKLQKQVLRVDTITKRKTIFYYASKLTSSIFNFSFSLLPFRIFRNPLLGTLVSGIMINNSLRTVKRMFEPSERITYIVYKDLEKELNEQKDYLDKIDSMCTDSLSKIEDIRCSLAVYSGDHFYNESLIDFQKKLDHIEKTIIKEQMKVLSLNDEIRKKHIENKQKVKKIGNIYNNY